MYETINSPINYVDRIAEANQAKVLAAMQKNRVSAACFAATTGYGYAGSGARRSGDADGPAAPGAAVSAARKGDFLL